MERSAWDPEGVDVLLDADGRLTDPAAADGLDLKAMYRRMVAARQLDLRLQRLAPPALASSAGEEAVGVGIVTAARSHDWIVPGPRDLAIAVARGVDLEELATQALHGARSHDPVALPGRLCAPELRIAPPCEALGLHVALAAGRAHAQRVLREDAVTIAVIGEGSATVGLVHEALTVAVTAELPLVVVCKSQVWPDGAPAEAGVFGDPVADRARAAGLAARRCDGADVIGVTAAMGHAIARARSGAGPSLVEIVVTPQLHDPPAARDPIERLRRLLDLQGLWSPTYQDVLEADLRGASERAFAAAAAAAPGGSDARGPQ